MFQDTKGAVLRHRALFASPKPQARYTSAPRTARRDTCAIFCSHDPVSATTCEICDRSDALIVRCRNGLNLIVEVSGEARKDKAAKVAAARTLWVPAINNHGGFGRWAFVEVTDPWDAQGTLRHTMTALIDAVK